MKVLCAAPQAYARDSPAVGEAKRSRRLPLDISPTTHATTASKERLKGVLCAVAIDGGKAALFAALRADCLQAATQNVPESSQEHRERRGMSKVAQHMGTPRKIACRGS